MMESVIIVSPQTGFGIKIKQGSRGLVYLKVFLPPPESNETPWSGSGKLFLGTKCKDELEDCSYYFDRSECQKHNGLTRRYCARTCHYCKWTNITNSLYTVEPIWDGHELRGPFFAQTNAAFVTSSKRPPLLSGRGHPVAVLCYFYLLNESTLWSHLMRYFIALNTINHCYKQK